MLPSPTAAIHPLSEKLLAGLAALNFTHEQRLAQHDPLIRYLSLLGKWNKAYNLTAVRDPEDMLNLHLLDCLATIAPIENYLSGTPTQIIDVGSGGGLPGIVFALNWPTCEHHLIDTVGKKVAFLQQCKQELKLVNLQAHHQRIENFKLEHEHIGRVFTCRAFASLSDFVKHTWHLRQDNSVWIALKGQHPDEELKALQHLAQNELKQTLSIEVQAIHPPGLENTHRHLVFIGIEDAHP
jgi:16S rRNA (guanine527-N7)-methyltransferase